MVVVVLVVVGTGKENSQSIKEICVGTQPQFHKSFTNLSVPTIKFFYCNKLLNTSTKTFHNFALAVITKLF